MRVSTTRRSALALASLFLAVPSFAQLSGTLYIGNAGTKPGGGDPEYATIKAAFDAVNAQGVGGNLNLLVTSNLTEPADPRLSVNTGTYTITLKPAPGVQPTVTFSDISTPAGAMTVWGNLVIGSATAMADNLTPTHNVVIDGSNTVGGTTRDMTFAGPAYAANTSKSVLRTIGDNDNLTIKNMVFTGGAFLNTGLLQFSILGDLGSDNLTLQNNAITNTNAASASGVTFARFTFTGSPANTTSPTGLTVVGNDFNVRLRGLNIQYRDSGTISDNDFTFTNGSNDAKGVFVGFFQTGATGTMNVHGNRFQLSTSGTTGLMGVDNQVSESGFTLNVYNNAFYNFSTTAGATNQRIFAVRHAFNATTNVYHNSVYLNDLTDLTTMGTTVMAAFAFVDNAAGSNNAPTGTMRVKNNVVRLGEATMATSGIRRGGTAGTFESDFNVVHTEGAASVVGTANNVAHATMDAWRDATLQDNNSRQRTIDFTSTTNLALTGASLGNADFVGTPLALVATDANSSFRSTSAPYAGAFEGAPSLSPRIINFTGGLVGNASSPTGNAAGAIFWAYYPTNPGRGVAIELHPVGDAGNYARFACTFNDTDGPAGSNYRCQVWPSASVPEAFKNKTVEYQFFTADYGTTRAKEGEPMPGTRGEQTNDADFTGFNWTFSTAVDGAPLPVELTAFTALASGRDVQLAWTTASETNNAGFYVERFNGTAFEDLGFVAGKGTTTEAQAYRFDATGLASGRHTFRLRQVDTDGTAHLSATVEVSVAMEGLLEVSAPSPNPFATASRFTLKVPTRQHVVVGVYDVTGRLVQTLHDGLLEAEVAHPFEVDGAGLTSGVYLVRIQGENVTRTLRLALAH